MVLRPKNSMRPQEQSIPAGRLGHLPVFARCLRQLRVVEIVNELVPVQLIQEAYEKDPEESADAER